MNIPKLKKRLNSLGYGPLSETGPNALYFGPSTEAAVEDFQRDRNLDIDGIVGPETLAALFPEEQLLQLVDPHLIKPYPILEDQLNLHAMYIMLAQVGIKEEGSNGGRAVNTFLKSVGFGTGYAWCMAFVYWAFQQSAADLGKTNPLVKTAGVLDQWNRIDTKYKHTSNPQRGDIFIMDFGKGAGHTGMITAVNGELLSTVEGNTNTEGSRNGDGVYERTRKSSSIKGYIRIPG